MIKTILNNGVEMPMFGLGVWQSKPGKETFEAVRYALQTGYRHIDTAAIYKNESDVGSAVRESGVPRKDIFVTTKLWNYDQGFDSALRAFDKSCKALGFDYIDLYLLHWPVPVERLDSWRALERLLKEKRCRAIGVSNFTMNHLTELFEESKTVPAVNQVEFSPFLYQKELLDFCRSKKIQLEGYSPLVKGTRFNEPAIKEMAAKYNKSPAQIHIRWQLDHKVVVIPKSVRPERIKENFEVFDFEFAPEDMQKLDSLDEGLRTSWDPTDEP